MAYQMNDGHEVNIIGDKAVLGSGGDDKQQMGEEGRKSVLGSLTFQDLSHNFCSRPSPTCMQQERIKATLSRVEVLPKITPPSDCSDRN